jgi:hypothetical protein
MKDIKHNTGNGPARIVEANVVRAPQRHDFGVITARHLRARMMANWVDRPLGKSVPPLRSWLPKRIPSLSEVRNDLARTLDARLLDDIGVTPGGFRRI